MTDRIDENAERQTGQRDERNSSAEEKLRPEGKWFIFLTSFTGALSRLRHLLAPYIRMNTKRSQSNT